MKNAHCFYCHAKMQRCTEHENCPENIKEKIFHLIETQFILFEIALFFGMVFAGFQVIIGLLNSDGGSIPFAIAVEIIFVGLSIFVIPFEKILGVEDYD